MIDLTFNKHEVGTQVKTRKGFIWTKIAKDTWQDETSNITWLPEEPKKMSHPDAVKLESDTQRLPTKEEFEEAEKHGIREILDMSGKWLWSSSVHPNNSDNAHDFDGDYGDVENSYRNYDNGSVRLVSRP